MANVKKTGGIGKGTPGPGRPKGLQNKDTRAVKEMILGALADVGGQEYLKQQAEKNPRAFLMLLGRILPTEIDGSLELSGRGLIDVLVYVPSNARG